MPIAGINGQHIHYTDTGGDGPAVIFSHGFLLDSDMFAAQIAGLKPRYRCIGWDQRGFGRTGDATESFTYWDSARDVLALMDHLGIQQAALAGLSQGGFLSMRAALLAPERVRALVLLSTRSGLDTQETIDGFLNLKREWQANGSANVRDFLADVLLGEGVDREPWFQKWNGMGRDALSFPIDALTQRDDLTPRLREIKCPTLVIHGDADKAIDVEHGMSLASHFHGVAKIIAGAGHAPPLSHPDRVLALLSEFVQAIHG